MRRAGMTGKVCLWHWRGPASMARRGGIPCHLRRPALVRGASPGRDVCHRTGNERRESVLGFPCMAAVWYGRCRLHDQQFRRVKLGSSRRQAVPRARACGKHSSARDRDRDPACNQRIHTLETPQRQLRLGLRGPGGRRGGWRRRTSLRSWLAPSCGYLIHVERAHRYHYLAGTGDHPPEPLKDLRGAALVSCAGNLSDIFR
jgi:hypothetical protein